jgi:hypothetical protein
LVDFARMSGTAGKGYHDWPLLPALKAFQTGVFEQRGILLTQYRDEPKLKVGACPGLSLCWARRHASNPNESARDRLAAMEKPEAWTEATQATGAFNSAAEGTYAGRVRVGLQLPVNGASFKCTEPAKDPTDFLNGLDPNNKYAIIMCHLGGLNINHVCAGYTTTHGRIFKSKQVLIFDPNFGEFTVELKKEPMKRFLKAWGDQFATYIGGRTGKATELTLDTLEVIKLSDVPPATRGRR